MSKSISDNCVNLVKQFEGCSLTAYQDSVGVWTIGYGTTNADKSITGITVKSGVTITKSQAETFLKKSLNKKSLPKVTKYDSKYDFNQNQLDALVSFAYNVGSIDGLTANGTRAIAEISAKFTAYNKAGGKELAGLTRRRKAEKELFDTAVASSDVVTFKMLKNTYLRTSAKKASDNKVKYSDLSDAMKKKCVADDEGYARIQKGKTFIKAGSKTDSDGNKWRKTKTGYWIPIVFDGVKRAKKITG